MVDKIKIDYDLLSLILKVWENKVGIFTDILWPIHKKVPWFMAFALKFLCQDYTHLAWNVWSTQHFPMFIKSLCPLFPAYYSNANCSWKACQLSVALLASGTTLPDMLPLCSVLMCCTHTLHWAMCNRLQHEFVNNKFQIDVGLFTSSFWLQHV